MEDNENKVILTDVTVMNESESQSMTESAVMDEVRVRSTRISTKVSNEYDNDMKYLCSMMCKMSNKFDEQNAKSESNFNELRGDINEIKGEMKQQNININELNEKVTESQKNIDSKLNELNTKLIQQLGKLGRNIENNEVTENKVSNVVQISDDYNGAVSYTHLLSQRKKWHN